MIIISVTLFSFTPRDYDSIKVNKGAWGFCVLPNDDPTKIVVEVYVPTSALPAKYKLSVENDQHVIFEYESPVYVLFNPWCTGEESL